MDWDQYYEKFYDWATSTQISRMSSLTSYGASPEVAEVAQEYMDEMAASRLIKKAVAYGVQFTPEEIYDLSGCCNTEARCLYSVQWKGKLSCDRGLTAWRSTGLNFAYPFITTH